MYEVQKSNEKLADKLRQAHELLEVATWKLKKVYTISATSDVHHFPAQ